MEVKTQTQGLRVEESRAWFTRKRRTKLITSHRGKDLTFLHPPYYGLDTYANVGTQIEQAGLKRPTMAETVSLVHAAFNSHDRYSDEIKDLMRKSWLWAFTGTLYVPHKGAYIQDNPAIKDGMPFMDESGLVAKLGSREEDGVAYSDDGTVRFVPFGYATDRMTPIQLENNSYVIALAGKEGAEKLAEVADKHRDRRPSLCSFKSVDQPLARVSALGSCLYVVYRRLVVIGDDHGNDRYGYAFGVYDNTGEASRAEK